MSKGFQTDGLSGLLRKEIFEQDIYALVPLDRRVRIRRDEQSGKDRRGERSLSLCYLDGDNFKSINDEEGHDTGDHVISELGRIIRESIKPSDRAYRLGGDEFAVVALDLPDVMMYGTRLAKAVKEHEFKYKGKIIPMTISVGIATHIPMDGYVDAEELKEEADNLCYESKGYRKQNHGKGRVTILIPKTKEIIQSGEI